MLKYLGPLGKGSVSGSARGDYILDKSHWRKQKSSNI